MATRHLGEWQWQIPPDSLPASGEASGDASGVHVHDTDHRGADVSAELAATDPGDVLTFTTPGGETLSLVVEDRQHAGAVDTFTPDASGVQQSPGWSSVVDETICQLTRTTPPTPNPGGTMTTPFKIARGQLGLSLTDPGGTIADDTIANYTAFDCEITSALISASSNFDTEPVPGTFCTPESETVTPRAATFELVVGALQRPDDAASLQAFAWTNDSGVTGNPVWFYVALAEDAAPKARGQLWLSPLDFGGDPRVVLTVDGLSWPIEGRPELEFGVAADV